MVDAPELGREGVALALGGLGAPGFGVEVGSAGLVGDLDVLLPLKGVLAFRCLAAELVAGGGGAEADADTHEQHPRVKHCPRPTTCEQ